VYWARAGGCRDGHRGGDRAWRRARDVPGWKSLRPPLGRRRRQSSWILIRCWRGAGYYSRRCWPWRCPAAGCCRRPSRRFAARRCPGRGVLGFQRDLGRLAGLAAPWNGSRPPHPMLSRLVNRAGTMSSYVVPGAPSSSSRSASSRSRGPRRPVRLDQAEGDCRASPLVQICWPAGFRQLSFGQLAFLPPPEPARRPVPERDSPRAGPGPVGRRSDRWAAVGPGTHLGERVPGSFSQSASEGWPVAAAALVVAGRSTDRGDVVVAAAPDSGQQQPGGKTRSLEPVRADLRQDHQAAGCGVQGVVCAADR
jgi:hypothetical protein